MSSKARAGLGVKLKVNNQLVGELSSVGGIEPSTETIDVSNHDTEGGFREFIPSISDGGDFTVEGNFVGGDAGQIAIRTAFFAKSTVPVEITFPLATGETTPAKWEANCMVSSFRQVGDATIDSQLTFAATFKISGKPEFTDAVRSNQ